jgi:fatty acid desaturase
MVDESFERLESKLRRLLPSEVFQPAESRLLWLPFHYSVIALGVLAIVWTDALWVKFLISFFLGLSFAGLAFVGHEALHGALTKRRHLRRIAGVLGFLPFSLPPRLWIAWHNRVHHGNANIAGLDPDALATLEEYQGSKKARAITNVQAKTRGIVTLLIGFTVQSLQVLLSSVRYGLLDARGRRLALLETLAMFGFWVGLGALIGFGNWLFAFVVPLLIGNGIVMMHIVTNHGLSRLVDHNDTLASSLSVTVPRFFSFYTLDFGYHTEHHLLPGVSLRHGPVIREKILELAPDRYQSLPLSHALLRFFEQLRVYRDPKTLLDPTTGRTRKALGGRREGPAPPSSKSRPRRAPAPRIRPALHPVRG